MRAHCQTASEAESGAYRVRYEYLLALRELGVSGLQQASSEQLARASRPEPWRTELDEILRSAQLHGFSDNGAILLVISKHGE
jgi:hypothetical protein